MDSTLDKKISAHFVEYKSPPDVDNSTAAPPYTEKEERQLRRKFDKNVLPLFSSFAAGKKLTSNLSSVFLIFTLGYLDRSNIGNANVAGMSADLKLTDAEFQWTLTAFYLGYVIFEFFTIAWKVFSPRYYASLLLLCWGAAAMGQGACQTWGQLMACRVLLGTFEAMMSCGIPLYLSFFYFRHELGLRVGFLLASSPLGSAWAGALAYGLTSAQTSLAPWRLLFVVEGAPTVIAIIPLFLLLVDGPLNAKFLNDREKEVARARVERSAVVTSAQAEIKGMDHSVNIVMYFSAFLDYKNYVVATMHFAINVSLSSISVFTPIIIKQMGYSSITAQGLSAPPYILSTFCVIAVTYWSDRMKTRGIFVSACALVGAIGYLLQATCTAIAPRYIGVYLSTAGLFSAAACNVTWLLNNQGDHSQRGAALVILQVIGQCGSFLGTRLFPAASAPYYNLGMWTCFSFLMYVSIMAALYSGILRWENKRKDRINGPVSSTIAIADVSAAGNKHPEWRNIP